MERLGIISNEKVHLEGESFFCDNIDMKSLPEGLSKRFEVQVFARKSKVQRNSHKINIKNMTISKNIFSYILKIIKNNKYQKKYLIISLSPYTFIACLLLFILRKKVYLYLRSDGYEEYKCYSKYLGPVIYHLMFTMASIQSKLIACRKHILKNKNGLLVNPSQLNDKWFTERKPFDPSKIKLLYIGRIKIEKGVFSLIKILKKIDDEFSFSIINSEKFYDKKLENDKIKIFHFKNENDSIIKFYDDHNIFILPSFTEAHPQVLDEALSRLRPVIVFSEISHVKRDREGVFVCKRDHKSLIDTIKYIINNYKDIEKKMNNNKLPTKNIFLKDLTQIIKNEKN